jgi:hypothetical protein
MDYIGFIGFALFLGLLVVSVIFNIKLRISIKKHKREIEQGNADKLMLLGKISDLFNELNIKELENTNGFVGFLEKSRDSAFEYIELVQAGLAKFNEEVGPIIEWTNTYGNALGDNPHQDKLIQISEAYESLKKLLPEEIKQGEINE